MWTRRGSKGRLLYYKMEIRNFEQDLENSKKLNEEWKQVIKKAFGDDIEVVFKDDNTSQLGFGVDIIITTKKGRRYTIEHKTRRFDYLGYNEYLLEIVHHRYSDEECKNKVSTIPGWLYKGTFDYIFIGTLNEQNNKIIEVIGFSSIPFKLEEFKSEYNNLKNGWAKSQFNSGIFQLTLNKKVTKEFLEENANKFWYWRDE